MGAVGKKVAEFVQHPMPASMARAFGESNGYAELHRGRRSRHVKPLFSLLESTTKETDNSIHDLVVTYNLR